MQTMGRSKQIGGIVRALSDEAGRTHDVPLTVIERASSATLRKFGGVSDAQPSRVRAYFWGVVRRTALGSRDDDAGLRARYLAAALAEDLLSAGHSRERVRDEVARRFGRSLPPGALDRVGCRAPAMLATGTSRI
jgi:hypothetical protein